jgi:DNA-binding NtrC family response regulator
MVLAEHFLLRYSEKYQKPVRGISQPAFALLARYDWPGNVRELEGVIEHAVLFAQEVQLMPEDLPEQLHAAHSPHFRCVIPPYLTMEEIEREAIAQTLERTGGNVKKTARILSYHRPTLYRKLKKFGLMAVADASEGDTQDET